MKFVVIFLMSYAMIFGQVFSAQNSLYSKNALSGWYTESVYTPIGSDGDTLYFVMLDSLRRPYVGKIAGNSTQLEALDKVHPEYSAYNDGHQEFSLGIDGDGYIHVVGDMHNFPQANVSHVPAEYQTANILYWKSESPRDISSFQFMGNSTTESIPGIAWSYSHFSTDRNGKLYFIARTLARNKYYQNGGRGLGLYQYDESQKKWIARGSKAPISDAIYPVIVWEESGQNGGSYQQYKGDIVWDKNNRMLLTAGMNTQNGSAQVNSVIFAVSDDEGKTFQKANGDSIVLPMQIQEGTRQGDVIDSDPSGTFEQATISYAFDNAPVVHYTANGTQFYQYWNGSSWSGRIASPSHYNRSQLLFNDFENKLYFINGSSGSIYAMSSFEGTTTSYDAGETFRYFDEKIFQRKNILNGISWKTSTGNFEVLQLVADTSLVNEQPTFHFNQQQLEMNSFSEVHIFSKNHSWNLKRNSSRKNQKLNVLNSLGELKYQRPIFKEQSEIQIPEFEEKIFLRIQ